MMSPLEYLRSREEDRSFQYIPVLKSQPQVLNQKEIQDLILRDRVDQCAGEFYHTAFSGGIHYKTNQLFPGEDHTLPLFSTLTTLRSAILRARRGKIFAVLCRGEDVTSFGYNSVLYCSRIL